MVDDEKVKKMYKIIKIILTIPMFEFEFEYQMSNT
jgi:hypothetical protein